MTEREQLEQAIAALEQQRAILGDVAVEAALAGLRQKLQSLGEPAAPLPTAAPTASQRKYLTVLFADVSGFTALSETLDAEEVRDTMDALWQKLDVIITAGGGTIDKHIGDAVMGLWGADAAHESDPENAVRAALAMQAELRAFTDVHGYVLQMRIGLNTGPVLLGAVGTTSEVTAMGDTVNLASRLEHAAPVGGILISHDTYRHVRGIFDVELQAPLIVKGKREPVRAYLVKAAKARAFRRPTRGVEGIETRTIGREAELEILQDAYRDMAAQPARPRVITIVAEAGVGKSRLLDELDNWIELLPQLTHDFKGRATPETQNQPYSLLRDLFRLRFDIRESDTTDQVREKFEAGLSDYLEPEQAHLVGYVVGFDFSATHAVQNLSGSPSLAPLALAYLVNYFRRLTAERVAAMMLEDIHWADDASLDVMARLADELSGQHWLMVCTARPELYERRPAWGQGPRYTRLDLNPLSPTDSAALVGEILQKAEAVPDDLRARIVTYSEGNPYYIEELIRMLLETGVIVQEAERWQVAPERLKDLSVPSTLTGILQARLDRLSHNERVTLQRASVIGRFFWDATLISLHAESEPAPDIQAGLQGAEARELIFRREQSAFTDAHEYIFRHAVLHDVTYETVLLRLRRAYHRQVAEWLETHSGARRSEYLGLIAEHYSSAGELSRAAHYLTQAGEQALKTSAFREALQYFSRALAVYPEEVTGKADNQRTRMALLCWLGEVYSKLGELPEARESLQTSLALARALNNSTGITHALNELCWVAVRQGGFDEARRVGEEALILARATNDRNAKALAHRRLGILAAYQGDHMAATQFFANALALYEESGHRPGIVSCLNNLGVVTNRQGDSAKAIQYYDRALALAREIGDRLNVAICLNNLGNTAHERGDLNSAMHYLEDSLAIHREIGSRGDALLSILTMGEILKERGDSAQASLSFRDALTGAMRIDALPIALFALLDLAEMELMARHYESAIELLGLILDHPSTDVEARQRGESLLAELRASLPPEVFGPALERGKAMELETAVAELVAEE